MFSNRFLPILLLLLGNLSVSLQQTYNVINTFRFPYGPVQAPFIGIFLAISLPLELPNYNVFFSYNFEANYVLPSNETGWTYPPIISKRTWDRKFIYDILEFKLKSHGYPGKDCLLRMICEASIHSSENTGVLGDILHILLTPSSSINNIDSVYELAELHGKTEKNCEQYNKNCQISILDLISWIGNYI